MRRGPPGLTLGRSSEASDGYKRQVDVSTNGRITKYSTTAATDTSPRVSCRWQGEVGRPLTQATVMPTVGASPRGLDLLETAWTEIMGAELTGDTPEWCAPMMTVMKSAVPSGDTSEWCAPMMTVMKSAVPPGDTSEWCAPRMTVMKSWGEPRMINNLRSSNKWCLRSPQRKVELNHAHINN